MFHSHSSYSCVCYSIICLVFFCCQPSSFNCAIWSLIFGCGWSLWSLVREIPSLLLFLSRPQLSVKKKSNVTLFSALGFRLKSCLSGLQHTCCFVDFIKCHKEGGNGEEKSRLKISFASPRCRADGPFVLQCKHVETAVAVLGGCQSIVQTFPLLSSVRCYLIIVRVLVHDVVSLWLPYTWHHLWFCVAMGNNSKAL